MKRTLRLERLARHEEKATITRVVWLSVISVGLGIFMLTAGIPLLGKFADFLDILFKDKNESTTDVGTLQAPILDELPEATNSSILKISGFATSGETVDIYLDGQKVTTVKIVDSRFIFDDLLLKLGENKVSAKAIATSGESDSSQTKTVIYDNQEPKLEVKEPADGQSFSGNNRIRVSGATDRDAQVFVNGFLASIDFEGNFEVLVPVAEGETQLEIRAVDQAGNEKVEKRKVNFRK